MPGWHSGGRCSRFPSNTWWDESLGNVWDELMELCIRQDFRPGIHRNLQEDDPDHVGNGLVHMFNPWIKLVVLGSTALRNTSVFLAVHTRWLYGISCLCCYRDMEVCQSWLP